MPENYMRVRTDKLLELKNKLWLPSYGSVTFGLLCYSICLHVYTCISPFDCIEKAVTRGLREEFDLHGIPIRVKTRVAANPYHDKARENFFAAFH